MRHSRFTRTATLGLAVAAVAAPTAAARPPVDLRSPDAVDAANAAQVRQDLRSPDAVDAAAGRGTFSAPRVTVVKVTPPSQAGPGGLDWGDAGIGAGATLAIVLLGVGGSLIVVHRRHGATRRGSAAIS